MSDTMISEPQQGGELPTEAKGRDSRRLLMIGGGVVALLVLGMAVYFLFLSGGSPDEDALAPVPQGSATQQPNNPDDKSDGNGNGKGGDNADKGEDLVPKNQDVQVGSDPFAPLGVEATKPAPAPETTGTGTDQTTTTGTSTTTDVSSQATSYTLVLTSVNAQKRTATIEVDGTSYVVKVNDMFTSSETGPFELTWVGKGAGGKATAKVVYGSDAPVELAANDPVTFGG
jgi:hypothetical protein